MSTKKRLFAVVLALCLFGRVQAFAWNSIGHMAVAYVAYQQLTPAEKTRVAVLLKLNPYYQKWLSYVPAGTAAADSDMYVFMMAATWPDEIKAMGSGYTGSDTPPSGEAPSLNTGYTDKQAHKYWHFIDTPFSQDGTPLPPIPVPDAVQKIGVFRAALATKEADKLKSYDLVWLEHLVGDVHQPLHCTTRVTKAKSKGDEGGNLVALTGSIDELHAFWDDALGAGDTQNFKTAVTVAKSLPQADATASADSNEQDWAAESFKLAQADVYVAPIGAGLGPYTVTADYTAQTKQVASRQVALAGARLAALLKTALACGAQSCSN